MMVLVAYDVATVDKGGQARLRRVAKAFFNVGQRVQNSVFECDLDPAQWTQLKAKLEDLIDAEQDSLRYYFLGADWQRRVEHVGAKPTLDLRNDPGNNSGVDSWAEHAIESELKATPHTFRRATHERAKSTGQDDAD